MREHIWIGLMPQEMMLASDFNLGDFKLALNSD